MKRQNLVLKIKLAQRKITFGSWIQLDCQTSVDIMSMSGYEWLAIDMEHTEISLSSFTAMAARCKARGIIPLARVRNNETMAIRQVLDMGAGGVIVPMVNSADDALKAVRSAMYPPKGDRGFAFCPCNDYGQSFEEYVKTANKDICVIAMIETATGKKNLESILDVEGIDGIFVGPYDLSGSLGIPGELGHPKLKKACREIFETCFTKGKSCGIHIVNPSKESISETLHNKCNFIALGMDSVFLQETSIKMLTEAEAIVQNFKKYAECK